MAEHHHTHLNNQNINDMCFVCGTDNVAGLKAQFVEDHERHELVCVFEGRDEHQSYQGRLHGGIASAVIDETVGRAYLVDHPGYWGVTVKLETRYHKPTPLGEPLYCRAHITRESRRLFEGEGTIETADGTVCVTGKATYYLAPVEKIINEMGGDGAYVWEPDPREIPEELEVEGATS